MGRRPDGALEGDVLAALWRSDEAMTPADVRDSLDRGLAYTTVMTVLSRLHDKGLVTRSRRGRAYAYSAAVSEFELTVTRMTKALSETSDRRGALLGFVNELSPRDRRALKKSLGD